MPDSIRRAIRSPFLRSRVQTEAPRPKFESLASSIASSSLATTVTGRTGPKISSLMIRILCSTPVRIVGAIHAPGEPGISRGPPHSRSAPCAIASSTSSVTVSAWAGLTIGPTSTSQLWGSPSSSRSVSRTSPSRNGSATSSRT